jgi:hypothetical protein
MVCTEEQLITIDSFATKNPLVNERYDIRKKETDLLELCDLDREMLKELGLI